MMETLEKQLRERAAAHGQGHIFRFWEMLSETARQQFLNQIADVDFSLMDRLINTWVLSEPPEEHFKEIVPVPVIPPVQTGSTDAADALHAGEKALRDGRVAAFVVAGGQGTRLGFEGPKGSYPIGPISGHSLFQYQAEKICNLQERYGAVMPWYIMVSNSNHDATRAFFECHNY